MRGDDWGEVDAGLRVLERDAVLPGEGCIACCVDRGIELVDLDAHLGEGRPVGDCPGDAGEGDEDGCCADGVDQWGEEEDAGEEEVGEKPGCY